MNYKLIKLHIQQFSLRKGIISLLFIILIHQFGFSQSDSLKKSMSFDFGLTRDRNINLWPIYKRTITKTEIDKQLLFPIYRSYQNFKIGEKRSHIFPLYWKDSSQNNENLRIISTYYPSLFHLSKNAEEKTKTFTLMEFAPRINLLEFKKSPDGLVMQNNLLFFLWYQDNQLTQRSHFIVFPAYWHFKNRVKESTTFLPLYSYGTYRQGESNYFAISPLFWHFKSSKRTSNLFVPIWWNRKTGVGDDATSTNLVFPIYWSHNDPKTNNKVVFPIVWSLKNQRYQSFSFLPLFSSGHSYNLDRTHLIVTPFYWHFKNSESENTTLFPILWKTSWKTRYEKYSSLVVFPIYWSQQNNDDRSQILLPFIWKKSTPFYESFTFLPLFSVGQAPGKLAGHLIITPLFWHYNSPSLVSNTLFPIWWQRKSGKDKEIESTNIIFPLYWSKKDPSYQRDIFLPFLWKFKNTEYQTFTFAPLFSKGSSTDGKSSYMAISPLSWRFKTEQGRGQLLFPLWWQNDKSVNGELKSSSLVVMLYWRYKDQIRNHQGLFPIVWRLQNETNQSFTIIPIFSHSQNRTGEYGYLAVTPIYWKFKNPKSTTSTLFPIWWNRKVNLGTDIRHFNLLIPLYYAKWDSTVSKKILFPVIWSFKNTNYRSFTFVPLFSHGRSTDQSVSHLAITPLFWYVRNPEGYTASLIPLFWKSKYGEGELGNNVNIVFPLYFSNSNSNQNNHVLFPLIWSFKNSNYRSFTFAPVFSSGHSSDNLRSHLVITPLFWSVKKPNGYAKTFIPFWWSSKSEVKNKRMKDDILFPVYWSFTTNDKSSKVLFPLIWRFNQPKAHSFTFVPFYSKGQKANGNKYLMITPLFWKLDRKIDHFRVLFPIFNSYCDTSNHKQFDVFFFLLRHSSFPDSTCLSIFWPIVERSKSSKYSYFRFAPLVWSKKSPSFNYFTIQPFFYHSFSNNHETYRILWELYAFRNQKNVKRANSILWKLVTWDRYANGDKEFRVMHLLYSNSNIGGNVEKSLFPFYYLTKESNGNRSLSVMLYFYNSLKRQIPNTKEFYQEERIFWLIRIRSNYRLLKQKGINVD